MAFSNIWAYLYYLTCARSEYYVHSPFVYTLMQDCLKKKPGFVPESRDSLYHRLEVYLKSAYPDILLARLTPDAHLAEAFAPFAQQENAMVFIDLPHCNSEREKAWEVICRDSGISLSIDLFRAGLIFPRREMRKEHFCLRYF